MKRLSMRIRASSKWITQTLLLSIIPVILFGSLIYYMGSRIVQEEIHRSSMESLSQVRHQVESDMVNIEQMSNQIALQSDIIALMNIQNETTLGAYPRTNAVRNQLSQIKNVTDTIHSIYFYHIGQQIIVNHDIVSNVNERRVFRDVSWLDNVDDMIAARSLQKWVAPREIVSLNGEATSTLTHIRLLPMLYKEPKAVIVVNMKPDFLQRTISRFPLNAEGKLFVMNKEGQLIARIPDESGEGDKDDALLHEMGRISQEGVRTTRVGEHFLSVLRSDKNGWTYAIAVPAYVPRQPVEEFKRIIIIITVVLCLMVVYSAYFTHSKFQRSIRSILERLSSARPSEAPQLQGDAIAVMEEGINRLLATVKEGQSKRDVHLSFLRSHYLHSLIHGNAVDVSRLAKEIDRSELFPLGKLCVMIAQMDESGQSSFRAERELFLFAVSNIGTELNKLQEQDGSTFRMESIITDRHTVLIVNYSDDADNDKLPVTLADQLRSVVKQILKQTITIGVGTGVDSAHDLAYSYRDALQALRMNVASAYDEVLPYANMTLVAEKLVHYPSAEEQELLHALRSRDGALAERSLKAFRDELDGEHASLQMAKTFYLQLLVAVIRLVQEYEEDIVAVFGENPYESFFRMESVPQIDNWFREWLMSPILRYMDSVKRRKTETIIRQTVDMIHDRYSSDLSLQMAADEMGISVSYLSKLFKEELGETFIDYVTRIRLEKAQGLLVETDLNMGQVAEAIGYTSVQQMFRVFKKKLGMTPGEYRESAKTKETE
ncbi:helix-turn-helix domain-containing protein [Paenibacillus sp. PAMC21692]|uniref:helix-turn-helix domain-containing protein n=1 Tax=Paenibacillus sp. PAMC21692 TaxID=2762320 RepID=UPI00164DBBEB|nr:helix-turn-helix domain-containing protein [Paenibacillus sp. PAMC21692]QNK59632.1 helix-turn-helix domain-containing protein [Paenibacillus sp. PAMC21692]